MKKLTIEIKEDGEISFRSKGLTNIELIGLFNHYKNVVEIDLMRNSK